MDFLHILINNNDINTHILLSNIILTDSKGVKIPLNLDFNESNEWSVSDIDLSGDFRIIANLELNGEFVTSNLSNISIDFGHRIINQPPNCSQAYPGVTMLWPPNHQLIDIKILGITDPDSDPLKITIDGIYQDEPVNEKGDGNTEPDGFGLGTPVAKVRSERSGKGNGRVYHIFFTASDIIDNNCSDEVIVFVPKSMGQNKVTIDEGPLYNSTIVQLNNENPLSYNENINNFQIGIDDIISEPYPNPVNSEASVVAKVKYNQNVNIEILDPMGNKIKDIFSGYVNVENPVYMKINSSEFVNGIYFLKATGDEVSTIKKVIFIK